MIERQDLPITEVSRPHFMPALEAKTPEVAMPVSATKEVTVAELKKLFESMQQARHVGYETL